MPESPVSRIRDCPYPATTSGMCRRAADMVLMWEAGDYQAVIAWMRRIGCEVEEMEWSGEGADRRAASWTVDGIAGVRCGMAAGMSAIDVVPQFGLILAGAFWPQVYPYLQAMVNRAAGDRMRAARAADRGGAPAGNPPAPPEVVPARDGAPPLPRRMRGAE
jgi:hypothetical protein